MFQHWGTIVLWALGLGTGNALGKVLFSNDKRDAFLLGIFTFFLGMVMGTILHFVGI